MNYFAKNLLFLRKKNDVTQVELASELNKGQSTITGWENGIYEPKISELLIISEFFKISIDNLIKVDLGNGNLIDKKESGENGNVIGNPNGNVIDKNKDTSEQDQVGESTAIWAILGRLARFEDQLTEINEKLNQLRASSNNDTETTP